MYLDERDSRISDSDFFDDLNLNIDIIQGGLQNLLFSLDQNNQY